RGASAAPGGAGRQGTGERRGRGDRCNHPGGRRPPPVRVRDRHDVLDDGGDGDRRARDPPREGPGPRAGPPRLERGGAQLVLDAYRYLADAVLDPMARRLRHVSPDALTWAALVFAGFAGIGFLFRGGWALVLGALFVFLNALLDALDGKVAKLTKKASRRGDFLDHVLDRYADVLMLGGLSLGPYFPTWLGLRAFIGVLGAGYTGTHAPTVGAG